jgi:hypothetical protein
LNVWSRIARSYLRHAKNCFKTTEGKDNAMKFAIAKGWGIRKPLRPQVPLNR